MFLDHSQLYTHTHSVGLLWASVPRVSDAATYVAHNKTDQTDFHSMSGVRARDPNNIAASNLRRRPHGHRDRPNPQLP
jgi:hypothetical protein